MSHLNKKVLGAGAAVVALSAFVPNPFMIGEAMAQATAQDTMNITAKVINPMDISQKVKLNFGSFAVGAAASAKIDMPATGAMSVALGDAVLIGGNAVGKVSFNAPNSATFTISVAAIATPIVLTNAGTTAPSKTMKVDQIYLKATNQMLIGNATASITLNAGNTDTTAKITVGTSGSAAIGARLTTINPGQTVGTYLGTYTMQVTL